MKDNIFLSYATIPLVFYTKSSEENKMLFSEQAVYESMQSAKGMPVLGSDQKPIGFVDSEREVEYETLDDRIICNVPVVFFNTGVSMSNVTTDDEVADAAKIIGFTISSIYFNK